MSSDHGEQDEEPCGEPAGLLQFEVEGTSMWPALEPGTTVSVAPPQRCADHGVAWPPKVGAIVVARHPFRPIVVIKRVAAIDERGLELRGDDFIESEDSGALGRFGLASIVGVVVEEG